MTEINLMTSGQRLIVTQRVVIASGDIESVQVKAIFDSAWDNYPVRTATFYTSKDSTVYERLMVDNECTVPHEVLAESATLFIGIRGASTDGAKIKTSSLVKYKIEPGAIVGDTTLTPSMDLYQQFLASLDDKVDPIRADFYAQIEAKIAELDAKMKQHEEALADITEGEVLWENPDTTVDFPAQTIALDLSAYKRITVLFKDGKNKDRYREENASFKDVSYSSANTANDYVRYRLFSWNNTGVVFYAACNDNEESIPVKIIGYKSGGLKSTFPDGGFDI